MVHFFRRADAGALSSGVAYCDLSNHFFKLEMVEIVCLRVSESIQIRKGALAEQKVQSSFNPITFLNSMVAPLQVNAN